MNGTSLSPKKKKRAKGGHELRENNKDESSKRRRRDIFGTRIRKGQKKHKISFADQIATNKSLTK